MDNKTICGFVNSGDVRQHLLDIHYEFTAPEAAWLVYRCQGLTMKERHAAWREIIRDMPDCRIPQRLNLEAIDSFHARLERYMDLENRHRLDGDDFEVFSALEGMCFDFPVPFRRGDMLIDCTRRERVPFVLNFISTWNSQTMLAKGFEPYERPAGQTDWAGFDRVHRNILAQGDSSDIHPMGVCVLEDGIFFYEAVNSFPTDLEYVVRDLR